jgi:hypothetical protein
LAASLISPGNIQKGEFAMGDKGGKKDKNKADKQKQQNDQKKKQEQQKKLPTKKPA